MNKLNGLIKCIKKFGFSGLLFFLKNKLSRSTKYYLIKVSDHPFFLRRNTSDFLVFEEIFLDSQYEFNALPKDAKYLIDAGANVGLSALFFQRKYPDAEIICIEPEDKNYRQLVINTGHYETVSHINGALWNKKTNLSLHQDNKAEWSFSVQANLSNKNTNTVQSITMQDVIARWDMDIIDIVKLDIEGGEKDLFSSDYEWIKKVKYLIIEFHQIDGQDTSGNFKNVMEKLNFIKYSQRQNELYVNLDLVNK
ncbi:MAG: FkbM family methyltransferase [Vicingaceae bacterium]